MKKLIFTFLSLVVIIFTVSAQENIRRCGVDEINTQSLLNNNNLLELYSQQIGNGINNIIQYDSTLANTDTTYTIQVVVHVVYLNDNKYENIPTDIIQTQIDALNRDFNLLNADSINLRPFFIPFRGNAKIKFELAKKAPNGAASTGITRTQGKLGNLAGWDPISTLIWTALGVEPLKEDFFLFTGSTGKSPWPSNKYLNLYVCDLNKQSRKCASCLTLCDTCGALGGFAYPPSNAINWGPLALDRGKNDGIVIDFRFFGINNWYARDSTSQRFRDFYSKGRTVVHEVGHYLGLQHSWGNVLPLPGFDDGCAIDDFIDDTPEEAEAFANNIPRGSLNPCDSTVNSCTKEYLGRDWPDMYENYMDYSTDLCYNLFTKQQVNLMRYNLLTRRSGLITTRIVETSVPTAIKISTLKENNISIHPNPTNNILFIENKNNRTDDIQLQIFDVTGKIVMIAKIEKSQNLYSLSVQDLPVGVYAIKLFSDNFSTTGRFIKEK